MSSPLADAREVRSLERLRRRLDYEAVHGGDEPAWQRFRDQAVPFVFMYGIPLLLLNAALSYAGSRPRPRLPKRPPCPPRAGKKTLARQFAYQSKAETGRDAAI